ncbi:hypothetical protein QOL99_02285 [Deinococcus sp. MIMF12]|uniref:Tetratricopeptide repeat protein n=1 Tax=Deinococcus rhizophilus TaxID=3049544 RepID=A0ABT7JD66_9DEIO|nr:tetratricopeptide repeat protein [Deinococcus rhizophilus]MDL2342972.1 hypothetical protein [Deinococcus rhizophilus]
MPPVEDASAFAALPGALQLALLPLAFERVWHPVRSLQVAPDLPDGWWQAVITTLHLTPSPDGTVEVPESLRTQLTQRLATEQPHVYREAARRASREAHQQGDIRRAVALLHDIGDAEAADLLLEDWLSDRINASEHELAQHTIETLLPQQVGPRARAAYWISVMVSAPREQAATARHEVQAAYDAGEHNPRLLHTLSYALQYDGHYALALQVVEQGLKAGATGLDRLRLTHQKSMCLSYLARHEEHLAAAQDLLEEAQRQGNVSFTASAHATLAYAHEDLGDWDTAEVHYQRGAQLFRRISQTRLLATLLNNYAQSLAGRGRPVEAFQLLDEADALPETTLIHHAWIALSRAIVQHHSGLHSEALVTARRASELLAEAHLPGDELVALLIEAERLALDGQLEEAQQRLREAQAMRSDDPANVAALDLTAAVLAYVTGQIERAKALLEASLTPDLPAWDQARAHAYLAAIAYREGQSPDLDALAQALTLTDAPLLTDALALRPFLSWLGTQPEWAERVTQVFAQSRPAGQIPLRLELFGPIEVHGPSRRVAFKTRRAAELLAFLALNGPARRRDLLAGLWEGIPDKLTVDLFKKTLKHLRVALDELLPPEADPVPVSSGIYSLHPLLEIRTAWLPGGLFPAPDVRQSGELTIRGAFLADAQGPWADDLREEVHQQLRTALAERGTAGDPTATRLLAQVRGL